MKIRKFMNKKHRAAIGLEGILSTPVVFIMFLILLVFVYFSMSYVNYGNTANKVAQYMNARNTQLSHNNLPLDNNIFKKSKETGLNSMLYGTTMDSNGHSNGNDDENLRKMLGTALMQVAYNGHIQSDNSGDYNYNDTEKLKTIDLPFTKVEKVVAATEHPIQVDDEEGNQGDTVKVTIYYSFENPFTKNTSQEFAANGINEIH